MTERAGSAGDVVVLIPMLNEARVIQSVVAEVCRVFSRVVCIDDGSCDNSAELASAAGAVVVRHPLNLGQGAAIQTGLDFALAQPGVEYVVTFDADGQHRVEDAARMVEAARAENLDVILGSRFLAGGRHQVPRARRAILLCAVAFTRFTTGLRLTDSHNGLRVLNHRAAAAMRIRLPGMAHASEILDSIAQAGLTYREFPVRVVYTDYSRAKGQPGINSVNILFDLLAARFQAVRP